MFIALIALRLKDPLSPRKFTIPFNIPLTFRGERVKVSGGRGDRLHRHFLDSESFTMITHEIGRIAGPAWLFFGLIGYLHVSQASQGFARCWGSRSL